jgi:hypothetical protein
MPYTFVGCNFYSNVQFVSPLFNIGNCKFVNCVFPTSGTGVIDYQNKLIQNGVQSITYSSGGNISTSPLASVTNVTLNGSPGIVYAQNAQLGIPFTIIVTQGVAGNYTITWGSAFATSPAIPAPTVTAGATSVYTFVNDGTLTYLVGCQK